MQDNPYTDRKKLTFAQAEGVEPLPTQLAVKEISQEMRAKLWHVVHESMLQFRKHHEWPLVTSTSYLRDPWAAVLYRKHVGVITGWLRFKNSFEPLRTT
jgi:hypothetical protein